MIRDDRPTLVDLAATPALAAEVELDRIPELLGKIERLRAVLWARLTIRSIIVTPQSCSSPLTAG